MVPDARMQASGVSHLKIQRLIALRGTVDIAENYEIESWDDVGIRDA